MNRINPQVINKPVIFRGSSTIRGIAYYVPDQIQTVAEIENQITAFPGSALRITERTGLKQKRICSPEMRVVDLAMEAVYALEHKGLYGNDIDWSRIDCIIYCGVKREYEEPATAVLIADNLGITGITAFDVTNACLGFTDAWNIADSMIAAGKITSALIVTAENISSLVNTAINAMNNGDDPAPHFASLTVGDAAAAAIVERAGSGSGINLVAGIRASYTEHHNDCILPSFSTGMRSNAGKMLKSTLNKYPTLTDYILEHLEWQISDLWRIVPHQASATSIFKGADILRIPYDHVIQLFPTYGNCASAAVPMGLSIAVDEIKGSWAGNKMLTIGLGSGLGIGIFAWETS